MGIDQLLHITLLRYGDAFFAQSDLLVNPVYRYLPVLPFVGQEAAALSRQKLQGFIEFLASSLLNGGNKTEQHKKAQKLIRFNQQQTVLDSSNLVNPEPLLAPVANKIKTSSYSEQLAAYGMEAIATGAFFSGLGVLGAAAATGALVFTAQDELMNIHTDIANTLSSALKNNKLNEWIYDQGEKIANKINFSPLDYIDFSPVANYRFNMTNYIKRNVLDLKNAIIAAVFFNDFMVSIDEECQLEKNIINKPGFIKEINIEMIDKMPKGIVLLLQSLTEEYIENYQGDISLLFNENNLMELINEDPFCVISIKPDLTVQQHAIANIFILNHHINQHLLKNQDHSLSWGEFVSMMLQH